MAFAMSHKFLICCIFSIIQYTIFFKFLLRFIIHQQIIQECGFKFPRVWNFSVIFLLLICNLIPLWLENTLYNLNSFKFFQVCLRPVLFMFHWHLNRMWILLLLGGMFNINQTLLVDGAYEFFYTLADFQFNCSNRVDSLIFLNNLLRC